MSLESVFFEIFHWLISTVGIILNSFLIYLALFQSPKSIRTYSVFIINFAITDLLECVFDIYMQLRIIAVPMKPILIYVCNGLCIHTGTISCKVGLGILLHFIPHSVWSLLLSFSYRYYILFHPGLTRKTIFSLICTIYIPSFIIAATYWTNIKGPEEINPVVDLEFPGYNLSNKPEIVIGMANFSSITTIYTLFCICIPIYPVYFTIFFIRRKIMAYLMAHADSISKETRAVHSQMLKCLTLQAIVPTFLFVAVILYFMGILGIANNSIIETLIYTTFLPMPVLSPISYIVYVRPYRNFCLRLKKMRKSVKDSKVGSEKFDSTNQTTAKPSSIVI